MTHFKNNSSSYETHLDDLIKYSCFDKLCLVQGLSQDSETGCPKLVIVKSLAVLFFKGDGNKL